MEMTAAYLAAKRMRSLNKPSRKREYDYFSACGVGDSSGVADGDSVAVGVSDGTALGTACGDDAGDAFDDLEGRNLEIWMS